jgi:hypothetical protein
MMLCRLIRTVVATVCMVHDLATDMSNQPVPCQGCGAATHPKLQPCTDCYQRAGGVVSATAGSADSPAGETANAELPSASTPPAGHPDWIQFAAPVIARVLDVHEPELCPSGRIDCNPGTEDCPMWPDAAHWRAHVAPLIAAALNGSGRR